MPSKKIKIDKSTALGTFRINEHGFPEMEGQAVSRSKVHRMKKAGVNEVECDPACVVRTRKKFAHKLKERYGKYGSEKSVAELEKVGLPHVKIGSIRTYCPASGYWWIENTYWPKRNEKLSQNFNPQVNYDVT